MIDLNEWRTTCISQEAQLGASDSSYKIEWDVDQVISASTRFIPT